MREFVFTGKYQIRKGRKRILTNRGNIGKQGWVMAVLVYQVGGLFIG